MYLTSFVHREDLFHIAERWLCGRPDPGDALRLTEILICDGFVIGETLEVVADRLLETISHEPCRKQRIQFKGELRDTTCHAHPDMTPRVEELFRLYRSNPDFYYREAPINGVMCLDSSECLLGLYRIKRPRRIAEKANRKIANWIFGIVQEGAGRMAQERARRSGIPLEWLVTPEEEMIREFIEAEKAIARCFAEGTMRLDRSALTINDVGGIKVVADEEKLSRLRAFLSDEPTIRIVEEEHFEGNYQAKSLILEISWDPEHVCRQYTDGQCWRKHLGRGIPEETLEKGLASLMRDPKPQITIELILATFPSMVESELGNSIHEERIITQRDNKLYKGYIPMNVEFILEYLFAVGFSPEVHIDGMPIKLWGRYLPDTLISHVRRLYQLPDYDSIY